MGPTNKRRRYNLTPSLIGWAHSQNDGGVLLDNRGSLSLLQCLLYLNEQNIITYLFVLNFNQPWYMAWSSKIQPLCIHSATRATHVRLRCLVWATCEHPPSQTTCVRLFRKCAKVNGNHDVHGDVWTQHPVYQLWTTKPPNTFVIYLYCVLDVTGTEISNST